MLIAADAVVHTDLLVIPNAWVPVIVGLFLPVVNALLVRANASDRVRAVVGILLAGVTVVLTQAIVDGGDAVITWETLRLFMLTYGVEAVTYLGWWKPITKGTLNGRVAPNFGVSDAPRAA